MLREATATGETVEIAFRNACEELGVESTEALFEILETPVKKTFGLFGGSPAKVRAYIEDVSPQDRAAKYLVNVLQTMGLSGVDVSIKEVPEGADMVLSGNDVGFIIGHRGETLDALQYLASLVANQAGDEYYRITLDVGNYREKRRETLDSLGKKMAMKSVRSGRNNSLEPMNPYERRLIHTAVQGVEGAKSWSEGYDMTRHVVIGPVDGERFQRNRYNNNSGKSNNGQRQSQTQAGRGRNPRNSESRYQGKKPVATATVKPIEKKVDEPSAPMYGKIEKK